MSSASYLDRPIAFHRVFVDLTGSVAGAVFLSQLVYWQRRMGREFYKPMAEWTDETGLSRREQETARAKLESIGVLKLTKRGVPARLHYDLDLAALERAVMALPDVDNSEKANEQASLLDVTNKNVTCDKPVCQNEQTSLPDVTSKFATGVQTSLSHVTSKFATGVQTISETTRDYTETTQGKERARARGEPESEFRPIPDDWKPDPSVGEYAKQHALPNPAVELPHFIAYYQAENRNFRPEQLDPLFRRWLHNAKKFNPVKPPPTRGDKLGSVPPPDLPTLPDGSPDFMRMTDPQLREAEDRWRLKVNTSGAGSLHEMQERYRDAWNEAHDNDPTVAITGRGGRATA